MTPSIIRRIASMGVVLLAAFALMATSPNDSNAKKHAKGHQKASARKSAQNGRHKGKRFAKLSRHHKANSAPMTSAEKAVMIDQIKQLSSAHVVSDDSVIAHEAASPDIQADLAQAAKEEAAEDDVDVSIEQFFKTRPGTLSDSSLDPSIAHERQQDFTLFDESDPKISAQRSDIMEQIIDWLGTRYDFGGTSRTGIDCSAFTRMVFQKAFGVDLPRTAVEQHGLGDNVGKDQLAFGDLVFFKTAKYAPVTHVGIYIGEGLFANSACSKGVSVASLSSTYWSKHYLGAKRIFSNSAQLASLREAFQKTTAQNENQTSGSN